MTPTSLIPGTPIDLSNCDREPIHIPGTIQPHGALLAFDRDGRLTDASANASELLGIPLAWGDGFDALGLDAQSPERQLLDDALAQLRDAHNAPAASTETRIAGKLGDLVVHGHEGRLIAEWESRGDDNDDVSSFALKAHRMIDQLRRQRSVEALLAQAVEQVRALTGFDRVMAYRFRADDSGEVLAEARDPALEAFLGRRYPASDIPAQARRLYVLNTLRLISNVDYSPVPVVGATPARPLDMSFCVLRAVSPVHIEYLQNLGVGASMSVSIVVQGRLWGLIACHHRAPRHVPYSVRMACDVLAHMLASTVASLVTANEAAYVMQAAAVRTRVMESVLHADDTLAALATLRDELRDSLEADALVLAEHGKLVATDGIDPALAAAIVQSLAAHQDGSPVLRESRDEWPEAIRTQLGRHVGLLALPFHPSGHGWIIGLRHEQIEHVRWGGQPDKHYRHGPLGPRLTPRGSMDEWRDTVRDRAEPWRRVVRDAAGDLLAELQRASTARIIEADRMRSQLLAMLGHDLRDPLTTIHMATSLIKRGAGADQFEQRITNASGRMQRLIDHVMDLSRLGAGMGLGLRPSEVNLSSMLRDIVTEASLAHPGASYETDIAPDLTVQLDADRIAQVVANLLSNARHHGEVGQPIVIRLHARDDAIEFEVRNAGKPIDPELAGLLFSPFKHQSLGNVHNRKGLGLGLFIAHEVVTGHAGRIDYRYEEPHVVFRVSLPLRRA